MPQAPAYGLRVTTDAAFAKISIGDLRFGPVPPMTFAQAGRDTADVRCMLEPPVDIDAR